MCESAKEYASEQVNAQASKWNASIDMNSRVTELMRDSFFFRESICRCVHSSRIELLSMCCGHNVGWFYWWHTYMLTFSVRWSVCLSHLYFFGNHGIIVIPAHPPEGGCCFTVRDTIKLTVLIAQLFLIKFLIFWYVSYRAWKMQANDTKHIKIGSFV